MSDTKIWFFMSDTLWTIYSTNVDKNLGAAFIVVPIALMAAMLNKRVMLMIFVEPTLVVMIISQGATRTNGDEENSQDGSSEIFWMVFMS